MAEEEKRPERKGQNPEQDDDLRNTNTGVKVKLFYRPEDLPQFDYETSLGDPGRYPYTRGIYPTMYRGKLWTMRQYAGFSTSENTNTRFKFLLDQGQTGLSLALDLPTQLGLDSDDPLAKDDVGKLGVAIDTLRDMEEMFDGIPLDKISTSFTINSTASIILAMYVATAENQGVDPSRLRGTIQNDIIKEYIARGTYIFPPEPSIRLIGDTIEYCIKHIPSYNSVSVSGTHICECGATPAQGVAYPFLAGIAYLQEVLDRGYDIDNIAPLLSFHLIAGGVQFNFFQEIAKLRAARRLWAKIAFFPIGEVRVELIQPVDPESVVGKFLEKRGEGIHHVSYRVRDVDGSLAELEKKGVHLIDKKSRKVRENERVAFLHPKSTNGVLVELIQED